MYSTYLDTFQSQFTTQKPFGTRRKSLVIKNAFSICALYTFCLLSDYIIYIKQIILSLTFFMRNKIHFELYFFFHIFK